MDIDIWQEKWAVQNTLREIGRRVAEAKIVLSEWKYERYDYLGPNEYRLTGEGTLREGDGWDERSTYVLTKEVEIPQTWKDRNLYLLLDIGGESEVYADGHAMGSIDPKHPDVRLSGRLAGGEKLKIKIRVNRNIHDSIRLPRQKGRPYPHEVYNYSHLICKNRDVEAFYDLASAALEISVEYTDQPETAGRVYEILKDIINDIDLYEAYPDFARDIRKATQQLAERIRALHIPYTYGKAVFIGHSHLDLAFCWTWKETFRKIERTLSNTCAVLRNDRESTYTQSQMKIFEVLESAYPELYDEVAALIREGRVEPVGDLYVEFDTNIPSGESLIRQILYGKEFARARFGRESRVCFLPDTFGFCGILPQILAQAGYRYFVTCKLRWNDTNKPRYLFFNWRGIDGSTVLAHQMGTSYAGGCGVARLRAYAQDARGRGVTDTRLYLYGEGDGGGGISEEMVRAKNALKKVEGLAEISDSTLERGLEEIEKDLPALPVVDGELYFEKHRGVYTSHADIKKYNRQAECVLRDAEILCSLAYGGGSDYPQESLRAAWKKVLFNQFHDIIAGSCVAGAASEAVESFRDAIRSGREACSRALRGMQRPGRDIVVWNTLGWQRDGLIEAALDETESRIVDGTGDVPCQTVRAAAGRRSVLIDGRAIPPLGFKKFRLAAGTGGGPLPAEEDADVLENGRYRIEFDGCGEMTSILDKQNRKQVLAGKGNALVAYLDRPGYFEAWDIAADYEKKAYPIRDVTEMKLAEKGPLRWTMRISKRFRQSRIVQHISIYSGNPRIDIRTEMDFHEHQILLKACFDVDVRSPYASYDISMGSLTRPTTRNDSFEAAQFEVCMHQWADLSDGAYGVALLSGCKYGCDIKGSRMRITLLKTATSPDPEQDIGRHAFTYAIYPHPGRHSAADVTETAYEMNFPLMPVRAAVDAEAFSWLRTEGHPVIVETVKKAEEGHAVVIRLYEHHGESGTVRMIFGPPVGAVQKCGVLENPLGSLPVAHNAVTFEVGPFEIVTLKIFGKF